jgi:hypothetical protein
MGDGALGVSIGLALILVASGRRGPVAESVEFGLLGLQITTASCAGFFVDVAVAVAGLESEQFAAVQVSFEVHGGDFAER